MVIEMSNYGHRDAYWRSVSDYDYKWLKLGFHLGNFCHSKVSLEKGYGMCHEMKRQVQPDV